MSLQKYLLLLSISQEAITCGTIKIYKSPQPPKLMSIRSNFGTGRSPASHKNVIVSQGKNICYQPTENISSCCTLKIFFQRFMELGQLIITTTENSAFTYRSIQVCSRVYIEETNFLSSGCS